MTVQQFFKAAETGIVTAGYDLEDEIDAEIQHLLADMVKAA